MRYRGQLLVVLLFSFAMISCQTTPSSTSNDASPSSTSNDASSAGIAISDQSQPETHSQAEIHTPVVVRQQQHMSTTVTITVAAPETMEVLQAIEAAFAEVARLAGMLSEFIPNSEVSAINQQAGIGPVQVDKELLDVVQKSLEVSVDSEGTFDITWAALSDLWDFRSPNPRVPSQDEIKPRLALIDYRQVIIDDVKHTIMLKKPGMRIGLGGIAKGYVVDRAGLVLKQRGYPNYVVVAGGEVFASGRKGAQPWTVGILDPRDRSVYAEIEIEDEAVTTSGIYERSFIVDGVRYHHIIDPRTGMPSRGISSATILAKSALEADAYDTACVLLGKDKALRLARKKGFELLLFDDNNQTYGTSEILARIIRGPAAPSP